MFGLKKKNNSKNKIDIPNDPTMPAHVAFICDGNRRWAEKRGLPAISGHMQAARVVEDVVKHLLSRGVRTISAFIFSTENWKRSDEEVNFLMNYFIKEMPRLLKMAKENEVRIKFIGRRNVLSPKILKICANAESDTAEFTNGTINLAFDYGGQDEIVRAAQAAIASGIDAQDLTIETFESFLDSGDLLPIDLVVRTSKEQRISNFMLWKLAYAELMFLDESWPELNGKILDRVLEDFKNRNRRFGGGIYKNYKGTTSKKVVKK